MDTSPESSSHERAVLRQDNGELQEDVVEKDELDRPGHPPARSESSGEDPDEASRESFPASDPPASWAGGPEDIPDPPDTAEAEPRGASTPPSVPEPRGPAERVIERGPVPHVPERADPADPVPGTLPRR